MGNEYISIPDKMVAEYAPVRSRLMRRYARNVDACASIRLAQVIGPVSTSSSTYATVATIRLFVPDWYIGSSGTQFTLHDVLCETYESGSGGVGTYRVVVDGNNTNEETVSASPSSGSASGIFDFTVTFTPTANTAIDIELQAKVSGGATLAEMTSVSVEMASVPRAA